MNLAGERTASITAFRGFCGTCFRPPTIRHELFRCQPPSLYAIGVGEKPKGKEPPGCPTPDASYKYRLQYSWRLQRHERIAGRTGEPGLAPQIVQSDGSERFHHYQHSLRVDTLSTYYRALSVAQLIAFTDEIGKLMPFHA